jgi:hypothetical protein
MDFRPQVIGEPYQPLPLDADTQIMRTAQFDIAQIQIGGNQPLL